ncbi:MAG: UDP-3-O-(3-hydroxymyristoyl)glucosamine N-acyltransferase [Bacteroidota bacterium]
MIEPTLLSDLLARLIDDYERVGSLKDHRIDQVCSIEDASTSSIVWCHPARADKNEIIAATRAQVVVCDGEVEWNETVQPEKTLIKVDDPKRVFSRLVRQMMSQQYQAGIHPTSTIHPEAKIHPSVYIGPHCSIGKCNIGEGSQIHGNTFIYDGVQIGSEVVLEAAVVLGAEGFGLANTEEGGWERFPHLGGLIIHDRVQIGAGSTIDRGAIQDTVIGEGTKISKQVHISHNVQVGKHCLITGGVSIAGSTVVGDFVWISPGATILNKVKIGDHAFVAIGAVVTQSIPDHHQAIGRKIIPKA